MCLTAINEHAWTAERPILVYKILEDKGFFTKLTPFMNFKIKFKHGRSQQYVSKLGKSVYENGSIVEIGEGLHAMYNKTMAKIISNNLVCREIKTNVYYAVIPKGAKYYVGVNHDIVSDRQIIFRTERAFKRSEYSDCKPLYKE